VEILAAQPGSRLPDHERSVFSCWVNMKMFTFRVTNANFQKLDLNQQPTVYQTVASTNWAILFACKHSSAGT
jgi:hypothetical protein